MAFISFLMATLAFLLAIPTTVFFIEVIAAIALAQQDYQVPPGNRPRQRVAVLLPAHNESTGILPTLADIMVQIRAGDRLLVVADNCTDDTAAVAAAAGAEVVDRNEPERKGKGYALAWGLRHLGTDPLKLSSSLMLIAELRKAYLTGWPRHVRRHTDPCRHSIL